MEKNNNQINFNIDEEIPAFIPTKTRPITRITTEFANFVRPRNIPPDMTRALFIIKVFFLS